MNSKFDPSRPVDDIAAAIIQLLDGTDFASGDVGILFQGLVLGKNNVPRDPARYGEIYAAVAAHPGVSPWMHYAARIEEINGKRRATGADHAELARELEDIVEEASSALPSSDVRNLLLGGAAYNLGLLHRGLRHYATAAEAQLRSAGYFALAGEKTKMLTGIFVSEVERVSECFCDNDDPVNEIEGLVACDQFMQKALGANYPGWMQDNAPLHIAWAVMMNALVSGEFHSDLMKDRYVRDEFESARASKFPHWATLFQAWEEYLAKDYEAVIARAPVELESSSADNARLSLQILIADAEYELGRDEDAKRRLRAVEVHTGPDGGVLIAVAASILNAWETAGSDSDDSGE